MVAGWGGLLQHLRDRTSEARGVFADAPPGPDLHKYLEFGGGRNL